MYGLLSIQYHSRYCAVDRERAGETDGATASTSTSTFQLQDYFFLNTTVLLTVSNSVVTVVAERMGQVSGTPRLLLVLNERQHYTIGLECEKKSRK